MLWSAINEHSTTALDFKHLGLCTYPFFFQTLGPWFPNEMQNLLPSENWTLDHRASDQLLFSFSQGKTLLTLFAVQDRPASLHYNF